MSRRTALATLYGHQDWVTCVAVLPNGRIVSGSGDKTLRVWDAETGTVLAVVLGDATPFCVVALNNQLVVASDAIGNLWFVELE